MSLKRLNTRGFTIVEMMIAIGVFGVVLLLAASVVISLSRQFYKGLVKANTQQVARTISDEIINNIAYSSSKPQPMVQNGDVEGWCIADKLYMFVRHKKLGTVTGTTESPGVLMRSNDCAQDFGWGAGTMPDTLGPGTGRVELIGENMRLAEFIVAPADAAQKTWYVKVRVVKGDDDQLCSPSPAFNDCNTTTTNSPASLWQTDLTCKFQTGSQFCAAAEFEATVARRL